MSIVYRSGETSCPLCESELIGLFTNTQVCKAECDLKAKTAVTDTPVIIACPSQSQGYFGYPIPNEYPVPEWATLNGVTGAGWIHEAEKTAIAEMESTEGVHHGVRLFKIRPLPSAFFRPWELRSAFSNRVKRVFKGEYTLVDEIFGTFWAAMLYGKLSKHPLGQGVICTNEDVGAACVAEHYRRDRDYSNSIRLMRVHVTSTAVG